MNFLIFSTTKFLADILCGIASRNHLVAFHRIEGDPSYPFRIYDTTPQNKNHFSIQPATFLRSFHLTTVITTPNSNLDKYLNPPPPSKAPSSSRCLTCNSQGFTISPTCSTFICFSCRTKGVYCNCMAPPRGLTQISDTIFDTPNVARSRVTLCTGLKVGHCPNPTNKLDPFFGNTPFVTASPINTPEHQEELDDDCQP